MSFKDKTFCASPMCRNECGRKMTDDEKKELSTLDDAQVWWGYFCDHLGKREEPSHER
jgi:hypothetical protein